MAVPEDIAILARTKECKKNKTRGREIWLRDKPKQSKINGNRSSRVTNME